MRHLTKMTEGQARAVVLDKEEVGRWRRLTRKTEGEARAATLDEGGATATGEDEVRN